MISDNTNCAVLLATAKQMPWAPLMIAVLMPITSAAEDTSGPPELPGLSAASVWMTSSMVLPLTERIADRDHQLAAAQGFGIAERGVPQIPHAVGAQQRQIGVGVDAEHARIGDDALDVAQPDLFGRTDHVAIGQHQSVRRDHDPGAETAALVRVAYLRPGFDPNHRGLDAFGHADHGIGIGVEQGVIAGGGLPGRLR